MPLTTRGAAVTSTRSHPRSGTTRTGSYRTLLAYPVVGRTFALALVGRLGYAVLALPLTFLFTVRQTTGSFAARPPRRRSSARP